MKKNIYQIIPLLLLFIFLFSCKKDKNNPPVIFISPTDINIIAKTNDILELKIKVSSDKNLSRFIINAKLENSYSHKLFDTLISGKNLYYSYFYKIPDTLSTGTSIIFTFYAYDQDGNMGETAKRIIINGAPTTLTESTGHIIYSKYSEKQDAYNIATNTSIFSKTSQDSLLDFVDYDTIVKDSSLNKSFYSPAGNKFVRFNNFDYANATNIKAKEAYDSGNKLDIISDIKEQDIIIIKRNNKEIYIVLKITKINDESGIINDRYEFNVKK